MRGTTGIACTVLLLMVTLSDRGAAQATSPIERTGTISGYLFDPFGEPATGITLTLDNGVTDSERPLSGPPVLLETRTDEFGYYRFDEVPAGAYMLTPAVAWARPLVVYGPPGGSVQHDVWIVFETVQTAFRILKRPPGPLPPGPTSDSASSGVSPPAPSVIGPRYVRRAAQEFPEEVVREGTVVLEGHIGVDGMATAMRITSATEPDLAAPAFAAVQRERWVAARVGDVPLEVPLRVVVTFVPRPL